jgi:agmatine/peptidylarginine deiminase
MPNITVKIVTTYAEVVGAIMRNNRVTILCDQNEIQGVLRHVTCGDGTVALLPTGGDLRSAWVRITTRQGPDVWVAFPELVRLWDEALATFHS